MAACYSNVKIREPYGLERVKILASENFEITEHIVSKWQNILDLIAKIADIPTALIMKLNEDTVEVFLHSHSEENQYKVGQKEKLGEGIYCETVIGTRQCLMVPDASKSKVWQENKAELEMNMVAYLGYPVIWPDGEVFGTICILDSKENHFSEIIDDSIRILKQSIETDLTLIRSNQLIRECEEKYWLLADNTSDVIITIDPMGHIRYVSPSVEKLRGFKPEEVMQQTIEDILTPEGATIARAGLKKTLDAIQSGLPLPTFRGDFEQICKDGSKVWTDVTTTCMTNSDGEYTGTETLARDISKRKEAEIAVLRDRILLRTLIDNIPDPIYIKDLEGRKILANNADLEVMGISAESDVIGKTDLEIYSEDDKKDGFNQDIRVLTSGDPIVNQEVHFLDKKGEACWMLITKLPLFDEHGKINGLIGINHNITKRKTAELGLAQVAEELKKTNAMKDKLFSIIAHDLRSPLGSISMSLDLMTSGMAIDEELKNELMDELKKSTTNSLTLLENLLNWARSQTRTIQLFPENLSINNLIFQSVDLLTSSANQKSIAIEINADENLSAYADPESVKLIIRNLFSNAVKFTRNNGTITISACERGNMVEVSVADTGVGMKNEVVEELFKSNTLTTTFGTNNEKGSGIGLALVRDFVERNGGTITVESQLSKGSTFVFTLPKIKETKLSH